MRGDTEFLCSVVRTQPASPHHLTVGVAALKFQHCADADAMRIMSGLMLQSMVQQVELSCLSVLTSWFCVAHANRNDGNDSVAKSGEISGPGR